MGKRWINWLRNTRDDPSLRGTRPLLEPYPRKLARRSETAEIAHRKQDRSRLDPGSITSAWVLFAVLLAVLALGPAISRAAGRSPAVRAGRRTHSAAFFALQQCGETPASRRVHGTYRS